MTGVGVLHLHLHHRQTRVRTSFQHHDRLQREGGGGLWARPPVLSPVLLQANHNPPQPSKNTGQELAFKSKKAHSLTLLLQNHLDHFNNLLLDTSTICSICARPPVLSPDACTSVADDLTSNKLHDFLQDLWHWQHPRSASRQDSARAPVAHAAHRPRSAAQGSATICSTTICSRLVTSHGTRGTQHHNVCHDVHRAPCESHDNLSEDVADASNQPHS